MLRHLGRFLQGLGIGIANVIPGVSGGTMALIFGIYEEVIGAASQAVHAALLLLKGQTDGFIQALRGLPWLFLLPLVLGILAAPFLGAGLLSELLETRPEQMRGLFFGLILGSLPIPWLRISDHRPRIVGLLLLAAAAAWFLSALPAGAGGDPSMVAVFFAAAVAISAMVLPGVSGAYLLLVFGMYQATLDALDQLDLAFIGVFGAGAAIGLGAFTVLLNWLLEHKHDATMGVLVGLMLGSLRALWPWMTGAGNLMLPGPGSDMVWPIVLGVIGLAITAGLSWWELARGSKSQDD